MVSCAQACLRHKLVSVSNITITKVQCVTTECIARHCWLVRSVLSSLHLLKSPRIKLSESGACSPVEGGACLHFSKISHANNNHAGKWKDVGTSSSVKIRFWLEHLKLNLMHKLFQLNIIRVCVRVRARAPVCVCVCVRACVRTCVHAHVCV